MRHVAVFLGGVMILAAIVAGYIAYFVLSVDPVTQEMSDGFGRPLSDSPMFMRLLMGKERLWAGWFWFFVDLIVFWGSLLVGYALVSYGLKERKSRVVDV